LLGIIIIDIYIFQTLTHSSSQAIYSISSYQ
jgi:hypothetical protein